MASEDITFCASECNIKSCGRHPSRIRLHDIPHSFAQLRGTMYCDYYPRREERMDLKRLMGTATCGDCRRFRRDPESKAGGWCPVPKKRGSATWGGEKYVYQSRKACKCYEGK